MTDEELLIWLRVEDTNLTDFAADRIEELLAERKKAVKALENVHRFGVITHPALATLAELKGESHE